MSLKHFLDEALEKGENLKAELASELLNSKLLHEIVQSDLFSRAVSGVVRKKEEVTKVIRHNVKNVLEIMDVPSRNDLIHLEHKLDQMEKLIDRIGKKAITVSSLGKIQLKKTARRK